MKLKKAFSLTLALALCLGLTLPAFAAPVQLSLPNSGAEVTLSEVTEEGAAPVHGTWSGDSTISIYTVPVGSSMTFTSYGCDMDISKCTLGADGYYTSGESIYKDYTTDKTVVWDETYANAVWWISAWQIDSDGFLVKVDGGSTPAQPQQPADPEPADPEPADPEPTTPVAPPAVTVEDIPSSGTAAASTQAVEVDGKAVEFQMYALKDANGNSTNYVKLRDLAHVLNGTKAQFSVGYDGTISLTTGQPYEDTGSEMTTPFSGDRAYTGGGQSVKINGSAVEMTAINLLDDNGGGYNYFKLRDLGAALGFNVSWSAERGIFVETDKPYAG